MPRGRRGTKRGRKKEPRRPPPPSPLTQQNIVATAQVRFDYDDVFVSPDAPAHELNLYNVAELLRGRYDPKMFTASIHHMRLPTCTPEFFSSGVVLFVGTSSVSDALLAAHQAIYRLGTQMGKIPRMFNFRVCNVVCSVSLGHFLDITRFWLDNREHVYYTKDSFEGAHFYPIREYYFHLRPVVFVLFRSGHIVITGAKSPAKCREYLNQYIRFFRKYKSDKWPEVPKYGLEVLDNVEMKTLHQRVSKEYRALGLLPRADPGLTPPEAEEAKKKAPRYATRKKRTHARAKRYKPYLSVADGPGDPLDIYNGVPTIFSQLARE